MKRCTHIVVTEVVTEAGEVFAFQCTRCPDVTFVHHCVCGAVTNSQQPTVHAAGCVPLWEKHKVPIKNISVPDTCPDCDGDKSVTVRDEDSNLVNIKCTRCNGIGKLPPLKARVA